MDLLEKAKMFMEEVPALIIIRAGQMYHIRSFFYELIKHLEKETKE